MKSTTRSPHRALLALAGMAVLGGIGCGSAKTEVPSQAASLAKDASPLIFAGGPRPKPPAGCEWVLNQTALPGDQFLLYLAAKCNGKVRTLLYAGGAHKAELKFEENEPATVEMFGAAPGEGDNAILRRAREVIESKAEAAHCSVRPAKNELWPTDAKVVDVSAAQAAKAPKDEPRSACGRYGLDEDTQSFWRVLQGFAWYFDLGQDEFEIDPGSFTIAKKDAQGHWTVLSN